MKNLIKPPLKYLYRWLMRNLARLGYYAKPSFLIIGAQKAGTSALFSILDQHPQIVAPRSKELAFFYDNERIDGIKYGDFTTYHSKFPLPHQLATGKMTYEATPDYLICPESPKRIYAYAPGMKLIAILREPIARAYSGWNMFRSFANSSHARYRSIAENRTFQDAIAAEIELIEQGKSTRPWNYVKTGMYVEHLQRYFQYFSQDAILILDHADLLRTPHTCLATTCQFLGIDDTFKFNIRFENVSRYESSIPLEAVNILRTFYQPLNASLCKVLNREFEWVWRETGNG